MHQGKVAHYRNQYVRFDVDDIARRIVPLETGIAKKICKFCLQKDLSLLQNWFAIEYSSYFISVMNLDLYVRCFDSLMSR